MTLRALLMAAAQEIELCTSRDSNEVGKTHGHCSHENPTGCVGPEYILIEVPSVSRPKAYRVYHVRAPTLLAGNNTPESTLLKPLAVRTVPGSLPCRPRETARIGVSFLSSSELLA